MPLPAPRTHTSRQRGFTLIEVLLASLILTLGAASMLAMQVHALRLTQESGWRARAMQFAQEWSELMQDGAADDFILNAVPAAGPGTIDGNCVQHACDAGAMLRYLRSDWLYRLRQALPQARATVCRDAPGKTAQWQCSHHQQDGIVIKIGWRAPAQRQHEDAPGLILPAGW